MRQGHNKRLRGRNRKGPNPMARSYESNGPDVKIRGTALHIAEKYVMLARDASSAGDRVAEQSYLQHAEHYYRIVAAAQAQMPQPTPIQRQDDGDDDEGDETVGQPYDRPQQPAGEARPPSFGLSDPQPYVNGAPFNGHREAEASGMEGDEGDGQGEQEVRAGGDRQDGDRGDNYRRRRSGRGRPRRPEGEFASGEPPRVPVNEDQS